MPNWKKYVEGLKVKKYWPSLAVAAAFLFLFGQAVRKGFQPGMPAYGDGFSFPFSPGEAIQTFRGAWDMRNPGLDLPVASVLSFLTIFEAAAGVLAGGNMIVVSRLFYFYLPLPLMFLVMYWFLGRMDFSRPGKFFGAFVYAVNFFTIGELLGGFPGTNYVQVLFPVILYCLYRSHFIGFSVLFSLAYILSDHVIIFIAPFFLLFLLRGYFSFGLKGLVRDAAFIVNAVGLVILLTLPYTYYYFKVAFPFLGGTPLREDVLAFLVRNVNDTYRYYTVGNALRLGGASFIGLYGLDPLSVKIGFLIPILAFLWFIFPSNWRGGKIKIGLVFSLLAILALLFIYDAHRSEEIAIFRLFPFFFRFRNPTRPTLFLALAYAPLVALTFDGFSAFLSRHLKRIGRILTLLLAGMAFIGVSYYLKPFYSGDYTFSKNRGTTYTIGNRYYDLKTWLEERGIGEDDFRTLWLPYNHEEVEIKIRYIDPRAYAVPINYGTYIDNDYLRWMKRVYLKVSLGDYSVLDDLGQAGVKYIIINDNSKDTGPALFEYDYLTPWLPGSPVYWRRLVLSLPGVRPKDNISGFSVFENPRYSQEKINPMLAGKAPDNLPQLQSTKDQLIIISALAWLAVFVVIIRRQYFRKRVLIV